MKKIIIFLFLIGIFQLNAMQPESMAQDKNHLSFAILRTYIKACRKESPKYFDKDNTCIFDSTDIEIDLEKEGKTTILETTIYGSRDEIEKPRQNTLKEEQTLLRSKLLLALQEKKRKLWFSKKTTLHIDEKTKCQAPVYYDANQGWIRCTSFFNPEDIISR